MKGRGDLGVDKQGKLLGGLCRALSRNHKKLGEYRTRHLCASLHFIAARICLAKMMWRKAKKHY